MDRFAHLLKERCEKANILQDYLRERWVEVMGYYEELFSQEEANRHMRKNAREVGLAEGMEKGRAEVAARLLADGMEPEKVAELSKLSIDYVLELKSSSRNNTPIPDAGSD